MRTFFKSNLRLCVILMVLSIIFLLNASGTKAQIIDPHPACSAPNSACWPSRAFNQWSCNQCSFVWYCQNNMNRTCPGRTNAECGGFGPCIQICDPNRPPGGCQVVNNPVACNLNSPTACGFQGSIPNGCSYDQYSGCDINTEVQTLGCCGPGSGGTPTPTPTTPPLPPSCAANFNPGSAVINVGSSQGFTLNVNSSNGSVDTVNFSSSNSGLVSVSPAGDASVPYQTLANGVSIGGPVVISGRVVMGGSVRCSATASVSVLAPGAWWQVKDADVITNGGLISPIPASCSLPVCNPVFSIDGPGTSPGVPLFAGSYDFNVGVGVGTVSSTGWLARGSYLASTAYNYAFFDRLVPGDTVKNAILFSSITPNYLKNQGAISPDGYYWFFRSGDLIMQGEPTLASRKVVLFVDGNLSIDGIVDLTQGTGFFMAIVTGDIRVNSGVSHPNVGEPELEGIFVTNRNFVSSLDSNQLIIRGMVSAYGGVILGRDLGGGNVNSPSEFFEYAPDLLFNFPKSFNLKRTRWKEVTP